ncbi:MAG: DPP IV N-terminal domain-containing protein [Paludibacter sp.]|nr:DPP IV N-terminal domain-containing protein [Paludibacter sp.]
MKKRLSYWFISLLLFILSGCDKKEACPGCFGDEPVDFRVIDYEPAWSPDGQWIAFYHGDTVPDKWGIYLISPDGENIKKWHDGPAAATPTWSPDGQWIAFSGGAQIWKKKIDGDSLTQLTFEGRNFFPSWSPDGQWITFDGWIPDEMKVYGIFKINNNEKEKILFGYDTNGAMRMPTWTNNSTIIHIRYSQQFYYPEIFSMDSNGKNEIRLTFNDANDYYPKFSNNKIVFTSKPHDKLYFRIWTMDADGSNLKRLTDTQAYTCDWSPDGKYIVYTDARKENGRLWIMDADGGNKRQLTFEHHFINF